MTVLIAGGGIAGLALGLTCHQIGVPFQVFESVREIKPLGVGINLQPTAVRELIDLGLGDALDQIGVKTKDYGMYSKHGGHVWTEPRGTWAGYKWPQYSVHRGKLHLMLFDALIERAGADAVQTGWAATAAETQGEQAVLHLRNRDGQEKTVKGALVIGADGIHSTLRKQMNPEEGEPKWAGNVMWRGTAQAQPFKTGASMIMAGHEGLRFVCYPISAPDPMTGLATLNWIAILNRSGEEAVGKGDWSKDANLDDFLPQFRQFNFDWIDVPGLIERADQIFEYPMVDREPLDRWTHGRVSLMGDAAHPAYPVGSNGAGSAIIDARVLGAAFLKHGLTVAALHAHEDQVRPVTSAVTLMNRVAGPDSILDVVQDLCDGRFEDINDVISQEELAAFAEKYKQTAGFSVSETNARPRTIPEGARFGG